MKRSDFRFFHRLRVRWAEVDMQKIVFNAHYLMYFDTAITEYWRALALPMEEVFARLGGELYVKKDLAHHVHLARLAVKTQGELFLAVDELQRLGAHRALHAGHALGLFGAQAQTEAHAVFGDHEADFAFFLMAFVGRRDHLDAVFGVEVARLLVEHVRQVAERVFGVGRGRLGGG